MTSNQLRFDNQVVVVTGAGSGLGKAYAKFFASRGAKVVVNDLGGSVRGEGGNAKAADLVVSEIRSEGGTAVANYDSVEFGDRIIDTAISAFGRIDVLINNAGILRDITLRNMKDSDWDLIMAVHVTGSYRATRAAWPHFRRQKFGRVIMTSSTSGLYGNFGQSNYAAAKMAVVGLAETLAKEGAKYNINVNALAPSAGTRMTATVMAPEMLEIMKPDWVVPLVAFLCHGSSKESGSIFEATSGHFDKLRWQRGKGVVMKPDDTMTPGSLAKRWNEVIHFDKNAGHFERREGILERVQKANKLPPNPPGDDIRFDGRVALVTGGGNGLGRAYAKLFGKLGAKVVVNDLAGADKVAQDISSSGGEAYAIAMSVEQGDELVRKVVDKYGRLDIVVNNAGQLKDKAFTNMSDDLWFPVLNVHLRGTYKVCRAAWPFMMKQKYGRIVNITSTSGIYGNFGQANYAAAKCGIIGFSRTIAREGAKYNIFVNSVAPVAGTNMTRTVSPEAEVAAMKPEYVAPLIALLCSDKCPTPTGGLYEAGMGSFTKTQWQRTRGVDFPIDDGVPTPEAVRDAFGEICNFDNGLTDNPEGGAEVSKYAQGNIMKSSIGKKIRPRASATNKKFLPKINSLINKDGPAGEWIYTDRDVILYNLGLGAKRTELPLVYENDDNFMALPTIGVIPPYKAPPAFKMEDIIPNFNPRMLVHGEQYFEIRKYPVPTSGTLVTRAKLLEVVDKGNAALVRRAATTVDKNTGEDVFYGESVAFIRGSGGFGGAKTPQDRGAATAPNKIPTDRAPDKVVTERTSEEQAALYRLMGDRNPLHVDPNFSKVGGFPVPILHGLCTMGISAKHVLQSYGPYKNIKVRFSGPVLPGQTLMTAMWQEGKNRIVFETKVVETGKLCISAAAAELLDGAKAVL